MSTGSVISWLSTLKMELILNAFFFVLIISFRTLHVALAFDLEASIGSRNVDCGLRTMELILDIYQDIAT